MPCFLSLRPWRRRTANARPALAAVRRCPVRLTLERLEDRAVPAVSFRDAGDIPAGAGFDFKGLVAGDLNGDGKADLVVSTSSVLLGNGDGSFRTGPALGEGSFSLSGAVLGDFNGDGKLDLAAAREADQSGISSAAVLLGNGDGSFRAPVFSPVGSQRIARAAAAADFNGDGKPDLAVITGQVNAQGAVSLLLGNGDGSFRAPASTFVGGAPMSLVAGDFNGDSKPDVAVAILDVNTETADVAVLLGNGDGTLRAPTHYAAGVEPGALAVGDFNGDGRLDLAAADSKGGTVGVLLGNGDGSFRPAVSSLAGRFAGTLAVSDFNGDGKPDLAVATGPGRMVTVLLGNGDGTFGPPEDNLVARPAVGIVTGDFNGDGAPDIISGGLNGGAEEDIAWFVSVLLNVNPHATATTTAVASSLNPASAGQPVTLTAAVRAAAPAAGAPTGFVEFFDDQTLVAAQGLVQRNDLGKAPLDASGKAVVTLMLPARVDTSHGINDFTPITYLPYVVHAIYLGDMNFAPSTSAVLNQFVVQGPLPPGLTGTTPGVATPAQRVLDDLYRNLLGRPVDPAGLTFWAGVLDQGASRAQVALAIEGSQEYRTRVVTQLYPRLLNRLADPGGLQSGVAFLTQGGTEEQLEATLLGSDEYLQTRGGGTADGFVRAVYLDVLQRSPSADELQGWLQQLGNGLSRTAAAGAILASAEAEGLEVRTLYQQFLQRPADGSGLGFFVGALQGGASREQVAAVLAGSQERFAAVNRPLHQIYMAQLYRDLLGRAAGPADLGYWAGLLNQGLATPVQVVRQIEQSPEYLARQVQTLYATYLHRAADPGGLAAFASFLAGGGTPERAAAILAGSAEYFQGHGGTADGFLTGLYQEALHRTIDPPARAALAQQLAAGTSPAQVAAGVLGSEEYRQVVVEGLYASLLGRAADPAGLAGWDAALRGGARWEDVVAALAASEEYFARL